jgi:predicted hydrocarbon binding protein
MLYWAGKSLARKYPAESIEELIAFFSLAGFGTLSLVHKKKDEMEFQLDGELIKTRFKTMKEPSFQLEAGFLAQQVQRMNKQITETYEQVKKRADKVHFTVKWDYKDMEFDND